ncbi:MAG: hypothetical protein VR65_17770 [Desulfobulbaceae bacterium BRH_c16a]|nr:MAG: hypothetical protein VR65_17770 [Desulfobulbaceae bacterium BRH_c16a]
MGNGYTYIWQFQVYPDCQSKFLEFYGTDGTWVQLFRRAPGFVETLLLKDRSVPGRYITIDRWRSEEAHDVFRRNFAREYALLDNECDSFTSDEQFLGAFSE